MDTDVLVGWFFGPSLLLGSNFLLFFQVKMISYANTFACLFCTLQGWTNLGQQGKEEKISTQIERCGKAGMGTAGGVLSWLSGVAATLQNLSQFVIYS